MKSVAEEGPETAETDDIEPQRRILRTRDSTTRILEMILDQGNTYVTTQLIGPVAVLESDRIKQSVS